MFAVIASGGKQHKVVAGEVLRLEKLDSKVGETVEFDRVLMVGTGSAVQVGRPYVEGSRVEAEVLAHGLSDKIHVVKFRRRKGYRRKQGHRQHYTEVKIKDILGV